MRQSKRLKITHMALAALIAMLACSLALGIATPSARVTGPQASADAEENANPSATCIPLGLNGSITSNVLVGKLTDDGAELVFLGTSNGLYIIGPDGNLQHFLYSPFGIGHIALLDDVTGDGMRDIVIALQYGDVPILRCYDGATWQKIWQFAPTAKLFRENVGWVQLQSGITDLEIARDGGSQNILITSDRSLYCIRGRDGQQLWRFEAPSQLLKIAIVPDISSDDADEIAVGSASSEDVSQSGSLYVLNGGTGKVRWEMGLKECTSYQGYEPYTMQTSVNDVATVDSKTGKVAVTSTDGKVRLVNLQDKRVEWDVAVADCGYTAGDILLTPDITGDGLPEIAVLKQVNQEEKLVLVDSAGNKVWEKDLHLIPLTGAEITSFNGKPVILETSEQELRIIDLASGELTQTISINTLDSQRPMVIKADENGYLLISYSGDLVDISPSGEVLWHCPGISAISANAGNFTGDATLDTLFCGSGYSQSGTDGVRLLSVMDGATSETVWSYKVPYGDLMAFGGLKDIQVAPDLVGSDGLQDIIGYQGDSVFIFSGKDGSLAHFSVGDNITYLDIIRNGTAGSAVAVGTTAGLDIFSAGGVELSTLPITELIEGDDGQLGEFRALDDINNDGISDLAVFFTDRIEVLKSIGGTLDYESHLTFDAGEGKSIEFEAMVPDVNKDGVREIAYLFHQQATDLTYSSAEGTVTLGDTVTLVVVMRSPVDGSVLLQSEEGLWPVCNLGCADFNGDGYPDSMVRWLADYAPTAQTMSEARLEIFSGKDGKVFWKHSMAQGYSSSTAAIPAIAIGDVNGDGAEDLAVDAPSLVNRQSFSGGGYMPMPAFTYNIQLAVYDVMHDAVLKELTFSPMPGNNQSPAQLSWGLTQRIGDLNANGYPELVTTIQESGTGEHLAVIDTGSGELLASLQITSPQSWELFDTHEPGLLGIAASGGVYFLDTTPDLELTSPVSGSRTGSDLTVTWEGISAGDFTRVYVDGILNRMGNGTKANLLVKPGDHLLVLQSIDENGRISYATGTFQAGRSIWDYIAIPLAVVALLVLLVILAYPGLARTMRRRRRQKIARRGHLE